MTPEEQIHQLTTELMETRVARDFADFAADKRGQERDDLRANLAAAEQRVNEIQHTSGCHFAGPGRGDCMHFVGLPGKPISGQHDGADDTIDCYGKPNGWCWSCWKDYKLQKAEDLVRSYDRQDEVIGPEFEGVDEVTDVIRLLKEERAAAIERERVLREALELARHKFIRFHAGTLDELKTMTTPYDYALAATGRAITTKEAK